MILKDLTLRCLDNFSNINQKIVFNKGNEGFLTIANDGKTVIAFYELTEEEKKIPEFGIYDLHSLLGILDELKQGEGFEIDFKKDNLLMRTKNSQVKYFYSPIKLLPPPPSRMNIDSDTHTKFSFVLKTEDLQKMLKMAALMAVDNVQVEIKEKNAIGILKDISNETSNSFKIVLGSCTKESENSSIVTWQISDFKMIPNFNYQVSLLEVKERKVSKFEALTAENKPVGLVYYIAILSV
jgi:hypothetical protein